MLIELMHGHKPIMPREESIPTWVFLSWEDNISRERLLELRIQQLGRLPEDMEVALERLKAARLGNKERFDKTHRLRMKKIEKGDWVLVFDSTLEHQHSTVRKFAEGGLDLMWWRESMTMPPTCFVNWMEPCSKFQLLASASKCFGGEVEDFTLMILNHS